MTFTPRIRQYSGLVVDTLGVLLVVAAVLTVLYYWDPTRIYWKQFREADPYRFDKLRPAYLAVDPSKYITIKTAANAIHKRRALAQVIWGVGEAPHDRLPDEVREVIDRTGAIKVRCERAEIEDPDKRITVRRLACQTGLYRGWDQLASLDELRTVIGGVYTASMAYFRPRRPNGWLVIYQHGYAGTYHDQYRNIERLLAHGYTVAAANHTGYGDNFCPAGSPSLPWCDVGWAKYDVPLPMRVHFSPLVAAINYARKADGIDTVAMIGLSAGGWITSVMAAVDDRIVASYPVAGFMPPVYQDPARPENPPDQTYKPLFKAASMLDQFVLAVDRPGRRQIQIFNRYDRCCYANTRGKLWEGAVTARTAMIGGGHFEVRIDETHAYHKISRWAIGLILHDLAEAAQ